VGDTLFPLTSHQLGLEVKAISLEDLTGLDWTGRTDQLSRKIITTLQHYAAASAAVTLPPSAAASACCRRLTDAVHATR